MTRKFLVHTMVDIIFFTVLLCPEAVLGLMAALCGYVIYNFLLLGAEVLTEYNLFLICVFSFALIYEVYLGAFFRDFLALWEIFRSKRLAEKAAVS
jgi:hypothetical protein